MERVLVMLLSPCNFFVFHLLDVASSVGICINRAYINLALCLKPDALNFNPKCEGERR
jgi:hypothetical protein